LQRQQKKNGQLEKIRTKAIIWINYKRKTVTIAEHLKFWKLLLSSNWYFCICIIYLLMVFFWYYRLFFFLCQLHHIFMTESNETKKKLMNIQRQDIFVKKKKWKMFSKDVSYQIIDQYSVFLMNFFWTNSSCTICFFKDT
jgi:hypothetical protein